MTYTRPTRSQAHRNFIREHMARKRRAERKEKEDAREQLLNNRESENADPRIDREDGTTEQQTSEGRIKWHY